MNDGFLLNMLEFMDYVQHAFYNASNWNVENSYSHLTATARGQQASPSMPQAHTNTSQLS